MTDEQSPTGLQAGSVIPPALRSGPPRSTVLQRALFFIYRQLRWRFGLRICGIYVRPLRVDPSPDPVLPGFTYRIFESSDVDALLACRRRAEMELDEAFVRKAFAKGDACEAIVHDGEIVAFTWFAFTPTHDSEGVHVGFFPGLRYGYHAYTLPEYRGRHWPRICAPARDRYASARGCTHAIAFISVDNVSSIRSATASGNRRIGYAGYLKLGRRFFSFRTFGVRRYGFRFYLPTDTMATPNAST